MGRAYNAVKSIVKTHEVVGVAVKNASDESLGTIEEIMLDKKSGQVAYVVLSFGGILGIGDKLFAIPWNALHFNPQKSAFILNLSKEELQKAPGFDKDHWPSTADQNWMQSISKNYGSRTKETRE